ncbi:hypothetical protein K443DRAFT_334645 [Laccaria amethystina LaAM-08-1]|uniref:Uncharacterized protein n=1 Tax=Laccaria amethystina LaAM-08-1 TaxID=1095629 RepID=A0A0C9XKU3_9AGAR|nr:hypothetical protein K443DRAFT_334645 [Laccaria amethystina LaAM-08-1]
MAKMLREAGKLIHRPSRTCMRLSPAPTWVLPAFKFHYLRRVIRCIAVEHERKPPARFGVAHLVGSGDGATGSTIDLFRAPQTSLLKYIPPFEVERLALTPPETIRPWRGRIHLWRSSV